MFQKDITIALTSCGRLSSLKKTITSIAETIDLSLYRKIMTEDSTDPSHINKVKQEVENGFLQWWEIFYTWGESPSLYHSHYNALDTLYSKIKTKYVFHCEDDQVFKKTDFDYFKLSYNLLEDHDDIGLILLRDLFWDFKIRKSWIMRDRYYEMLTDDELIYNNHNFIYMNPLSCFSLQPWLRVTSVMKSIMFDHETYVDEWLVSQRLSKSWYQSIVLKNWVYNHISPVFNTTKNIKNLWLCNFLSSTIRWTVNYRGWLIKKYILQLFTWKKK